MEEQRICQLKRFSTVGALLVLGLLALWPAARAAAQEGRPPPPESAADTADAQCGIKAYEWDGPVTTAQRGFPWELPPRNNFNWTTPVNYAEGTFHYRVIVRSQPKEQQMRLQLCFWQPVSATATNKLGLEQCGNMASVLGRAGTTVEWQTAVGGMWAKNGVPIDWTRARWRAGVAIKNSSGDPVSNFSTWNWNGEDPAEWYPLNWRFTAVVVPKGGTFCGWEYYDQPAAVSLHNLSGQGAAPPFAGMLGVLSLALVSVWALRRRC